MNILSISDIRNKVNMGVKQQDSKNVIITGVTGQDGSLMVDYLLKNTQHNVFGCARRLSVANHRNIDHIKDSERFKLINFDLTDSHSISQLVNTIQPAYFINFAAQSFVKSSWDFPSQTWDANTTGVLNILESIRLHCPKCRFYNAGSSEEFGDVAYSPQDEKHPLRPRSPYAASKAAARQIVKVHRESYDLYAIQGWLFNHESFESNTPLILRDGKDIFIDYIRNLAPERKNIDKDNSHISVDFIDSNLEVWNGTQFVKIKTISRRKLSTAKKNEDHKINYNSRNGSVSVTAGHKMYLSGLSPIIARDLKIGDNMEHGKFPNNSSSTIEVTPSMATFLGFMVGDGSISKNGLKFSNNNSFFRNKFMEACSNIFPSVTLRTVMSKSGFSGNLVNNIVCSGINSDHVRFIKSQIYCKKTKHKKVPTEILNSSPEIKMLFWDAYYMSDGLKAGHQTYKYKSFKTNSPILAQGLLMICSEILDQSTNINLYEYNNRQYYHINFGNDKTNYQMGEHLLKNKTELKKITRYDVGKKCFVYDIETECGYLNAGVGTLVVGNSPRRGEEFVTRKITLGVARIVKEIAFQEKITPISLGNLDSKRDWSDAEDMIDGVWRMLNQEEYREDMKNLPTGKFMLPAAVSEIVQSELVKHIREYVCASGESHTVREFVEIAFSEAGIKGSWVTTENPLEETFVHKDTDGNLYILVEINPIYFRPAEVDSLGGDSSLIRKDLKWNPQTSFRQLVSKMVKRDLDC